MGPEPSLRRDQAGLTRTETADLIRAIPALLLVGLLPGFGLATLIAPGWRPWERAAVSPGLSVGLVGVLGMLFRLVHVPFSAATVMPLVAAVGVAAFFRWRKDTRQVRIDDPAHSKTAQRGVVVAALVAGALSAGILAYSLHAQPLPPDWDPPEHGAVANAIAQKHDVYASLPVPLEHTSYIHPRVAFEATAALVSEVAGPPPAMSMMPLIFLALFLMPLGLAMLALETTGSTWVAALTPLLSTGMAFHSFQVILGRFPLVADATLVAAAVVAMSRLVRGRNAYANASMITAITAAIWATHGLEALTAALIGGPLALELLIRGRRPGMLLRSAAGLVAAGAGAALVTVLTRVPKAATVASGLQEFSNSGKSIGLGGSAGPRIHPHLIFEYFAQTDLSSPIALAVLSIGVVAVVVRRQLLWALLALLLVFASLADVIYPERLKHFWLDVVWPWGDVDRLLGLPYWVVPLLMAYGLVSAAQLAVKASGRPRIWAAITVATVVVVGLAVAGRHRIQREWIAMFRDNISLFPFGEFTRLSHLGPWLPATALAAILAVFAWLALRAAAPTNSGRVGWQVLTARPAVAVLATVAIALLSVGIGAQQEDHTYRKNSYYRQLATDADISVMAEMSRKLPPGSRVMTDSAWDAGMWVAGMTNDTLLVPKAYAGGELSRPFVLALNDACANPAAAEHVLGNFDAIFVGARHLPGTPDQWDPRCIGSLAGLQEIAHAGPPGGQAHAYAVLNQRSSIVATAFGAGKAGPH